MSAIIAFVNALAKIAKTTRVVANIGSSQLIKQLKVIRLNLENFKQAALEDDTSKMRQLLEECKVASDFLEKRLFKGLDERTDKILRGTMRKVQASKSHGVRRVTTRRQPVAGRKLQTALNAKSAALASAITIDNERERDKLVSEIDKAIGKLQGIAKSLESFKY